MILEIQVNGVQVLSQKDNFFSFLFFLNNDRTNISTFISLNEICPD